MRNVIKKVWAILFVGFLLFSCKVKEVPVYYQIPTKESQKIVIRDTVFSEKLVPYRDSISIIDTMSRLENEYAYSVATYSATTGKLNHLLAIKPGAINIRSKIIESVRVDSIPYPIEIKVPYPINVPVEKKISWYQKLCIISFTCLLIIGLIYLIVKARSPIISLIQFFKNLMFRK
jgi:hypothetical protein